MLARRGQAIEPGPRSYVIKNGHAICFKDSDNNQTIASLQVAALSNFHDETLAAASKEINAVLDRVKAANSDPELELAFLNVGDGFLLAWTEHGVSARDDPELLAAELGLLRKD
jgi:hypothetical protein